MWGQGAIATLNLLDRVLSHLQDRNVCAILDGKMMNDMTKEQNPQRITYPVLTAEVRYRISDELVGADEMKELEHESIWDLTDRELRELLRKRRLSKADMELNLRVLNITSRPNLVRLMEEKYHCSRIMAASLALKGIARYEDEIRQLLRMVSHSEDREALEILLDSLDEFDRQGYRYDLLDEARRVGVIRTERFAYKGQTVEIEEPDEGFIEARFALDAIWDGEGSMVLGSTEHNRRLVKKLSPELDRDPKPAKARRSLGIPASGFQSVDAAHQWALEWLADPLRHDDDFYRDNLIWWESYWWDPERRVITGRGYVMLHQPAMKATLDCLVREYQLARCWYRVLPLYLIRGRLEPPPKVKLRQPPLRDRDELLTDLVDEYGYELTQVIYNGGLSPEDMAIITTLDSNTSPEKVYIALCELADRRNSWLPQEKQVSYDGLRKIVSRTRARRVASAKYQGHLRRLKALPPLIRVG